MLLLQCEHPQDFQDLVNFQDLSQLALTGLKILPNCGNNSCLRESLINLCCQVLSQVRIDADPDDGTVTTRPALESHQDSGEFLTIDLDVVGPLQPVPPESQLCQCLADTNTHHERQEIRCFCGLVEAPAHAHEDVATW